MEQSQPSPQPEEEDPLAAAHALIAQDRQDRVDACAAELRQVLEKYGMRLEVSPAQMHIVPAV